MKAKPKTDGACRPAGWKGWRGRRVPISALRPGDHFKLQGDEFRVEFINSCRAYVQRLKGRRVRIGDVEFERGQFWNISPGTEVDA